jgi:hypothetical protein
MALACRDAPEAHDAPRAESLPAGSAHADTASRVVGCSTEARPGLVLQVVEHDAGAEIAEGVTVKVAQLDGAHTETWAAPRASGLHERAGRFRVQVRRSGHRPWDSIVVVPRDRCHVHTQVVTVALQREP